MNTYQLVRIVKRLLDREYDGHGYIAFRIVGGSYGDSIEVSFEGADGEKKFTVTVSES